MNEETKTSCFIKKCMHPRLKEVLEDLAPPSPMTVPRDSSQPRVGYITSIHKEQAVPIPDEVKKRLLEQWSRNVYPRP